MGTLQLAVCSIAVLIVFMRSTQGAVIPLQDHSLVDISQKQNTQADDDPYRLPDVIVPVEYVITLTPNFNDFDFDGQVSITVNVTEETDTIKLHYNIMNITNWEIRDADNIVADNDNIMENYNETLEIATLTIPTKLSATNQYTIIIKYTGYLLDDMAGFYRSSYNFQNGTKRWLGTTHFESTGARRAFPCFDEPRFKAQFQLNIIRTEDRWSISNTPLQETIFIEKRGLYMDVFGKTPPMSTYLVAFIVSDFKFQTVEVDGRNYSVWAREDAISQADYSIQISPPIIQWLEDFTRYDFEFSKMDEAAIPDFAAGAMENWGLVTYRERALLFDENESTTANKKSIATTIAHEFSHQWFGDLVSPDWWMYIWLNEGFATYFGHFATAAVEQDWRLEEQFVVDTHQNALAVDSSTSHPITTYVSSPEEIDSIFDSISYDKAGSVIRMMEHFLSTDVFKRGLRRYLKDMNHKAATADDLFRNIEEEQQMSDPSLPEGLNVIDIMESWTQQAGYPLIEVFRNETIHISQKRFLLNGDDTAGTLWFVPITYTTSSERIFTDTYPKEWLKDEEMDIGITIAPEEWIILNIQETGFYRVLYDEENYKSIIEFLKSENYNEIHVLNRAQLIDDSLNLARAGKLDYNIALDLTTYLSRDTDYIAWVSFLNGISFLNNRLTGTDLYDDFKEYVRSLVVKLYDSVGFREEEAETAVTKLNRVNALTWACNFGHEECIESAVGSYLEFKVNNVSIIPDLRSVVYCTGISSGGQEEWDFLWDRYTSSQLSSEQVLILSALGCSKNETILEEYLKMSITEDSGVRRQDSSSVFTAVYSQPQGINITLQFLRDNFNDIHNYYTSMNAMSKIINGIASRLTTREQQQLMQEIIEEHITEITGGSDIIQTVEQNLQWYSTYNETLATWLESYLSTLNQEVPVDEPDAASSLVISVPLYLSLLFIAIYMHF